jgi:hypothetical protein
MNEQNIKISECLLSLEDMCIIQEKAMLENSYSATYKVKIKNIDELGVELEDVISKIQGHAGATFKEFTISFKI